MRGFDRSKIKGLVARLVQVKNPSHATALELVAGGKLYQVVVDEAITGKALLDRGNLERRVTIIPLDKIRPHRVTNSACDRAADIAKGLNADAWPAIELIGFDEEVRVAIEYVFGTTIVVDGAKAANQICDATKTRTVTLDGDVYDPSGTISGGSKSNLGTTLIELAKLSEATTQLSAKKERLADVLRSLNQLKNKSVEFDKLSRMLSLAEAELHGIQKHLSQTSFGVLEEKYGSMSNELEEANEEYTSMQKEQAEKWELYHVLKEKEVELTQQREDRLGQIEEDIKEAKKRSIEKTRRAREAESRKDTLLLELESLKIDVVAAQESVAAAEASLNETNEDEAAKEIVVGEVKALWDDAKSALNDFEERLTQFSTELSAIKRDQASMAKKAEKCKLEGKKLSVTISRIQKERLSAEKLVSSLLKSFPWIASEKTAFGVEGGDYDFKATDPNEMSRQLQTLKGEQDSLVSTGCEGNIFSEVVTILLALWRTYLILVMISVS